MGPYGNTWVETPHFNQLAAKSLLFEQSLASAASLAGNYRGYWLGRWPRELETAWKPGGGEAGEDAGEDPQSLADCWAAAGVPTLLVTDEPELADHRLADAFTRRIVLDPPRAMETAPSESETQLAAVVAAFQETLAALTTPSLLWLHARALRGPWDAPRSWREALVEEDDPDPPEFAIPPQLQLPEDYDPDELLGIMQAYGGQVAFLDFCLGLILAAIDDSGLNPLVICTSPRGYPLGEHRQVGGELLHAETLQVPCLVRVPGMQAGGLREQALVQPPDIFATLQHWLTGARWPPPSDAERLVAYSLLEHAERPLIPGRQWAAASGERADGEAAVDVAIRDAQWFARLSPAGDQLFAKPDDRFERNEVSSRCAEALQAIKALLL